MNFLEYETGCAAAGFVVGMVFCLLDASVDEFYGIMIGIVSGMILGALMWVTRQ